MERNALLLLAVAMIVAAWAMGRPGAVFAVTVRGGRARATRGVVTDAAVAEVDRLCADAGVPSLTVYGVRRGGRIALAFSWGVPPRLQQRLRNWWGVAGWSPGPRGGPGRSGGRRAAQLRG